MTQEATESNGLAPLERMLIVQQCTQLIARFAERNDARDADALAAMFVDDGIFVRPTAPDAPVKGREAIREQFRARPANKLTRHVVANIIVTVTSATEAAAQSTILLFTATLAEGAKLPVKADARQLVGAYDDILVRDADGVWKFKERRGSLAIIVEPLTARGEPLAGDLRAFGQGAQLLVRDLAVQLAVAGEGAEAAVGAGDHPLAPDDSRRSARCAAPPVRDARRSWCRCRSRRGSGSCPRGSWRRATTAHSCSWRALAPSNRDGLRLGLQDRPAGSCSTAMS